LFPEPVVPMIASDSPGFTVSDTFVCARVPLSGYVKLTSRHARLPSIGRSRLLGDTISRFVLRNSLLRFCEASARCTRLLVHPSDATGQVRRLTYRINTAM